MSDSIDALLQLPQRKIVIAENDVFLDRHIKNDIFILMVEESIGSAGGRAPASATGESSGSVASHAMVVAGAQNSLTPSSKTRSTSSTYHTVLLQWTSGSQTASRTCCRE